VWLAAAWPVASAHGPAGNPLPAEATALAISQGRGQDAKAQEEAQSDAQSDAQDEVQDTLEAPAADAGLAGEDLEPPEEGRRRAPTMGFRGASSLQPGRSGREERSPVPARGQARFQPNVIQRFVRQETGSDLPLFGYSLFEDSLRDFAPVQDLPVQASYVLGPGDEVIIRTWGSVDLNLKVAVDRDGLISVPKVGTFSVAGIKAEDLQGYLTRQFKRIFRDFSLNATLGQLRNIPVFVVGQARRPGSFSLSSLSTLVNALFACGGPNPSGSMRRVQVKRGGNLAGEMDLYRFLVQGDTSRDVRLLPGDVIVLTPAGARVALLGAVDQPAIYELAPGETLQDLLAIAGGVGSVTRGDKVLLERIDPKNPSAPLRVLESRLDASSLATPLQDGDLVTFLPVANQFQNAVTLTGKVAQPLRYPYRPGMTLMDLLPDREALLTRDYFTRKNVLVQYADPAARRRALADSRLKADDEGAPRKPTTMTRPLLDDLNWDYAHIERLNRATMVSEIIPFSLRRVVMDKDPGADLALEPGDVVRIFDKNDARLPMARRTRVVRVEGEVGAPGVYNLRPGETLPQLLERIGGVTGQAYLFGIRFTREETRLYQAENLKRVANQMERTILSQASAQAARVVPGESGKTLAEADQGRLQVARQALARLRAMEPMGRVALGLRPDLALALKDLPRLVLEDGDQILVPPRPDFTPVVGAVENENAVLWKPGRTVGEVLNAAGYQAGADRRRAFLLRADGTVLSRTTMPWYRSFTGQALLPGDSVVVPYRMNSGYATFMSGLKDWTQIIYQLGVGAVVVKVLF
jgi:protein involved in polysaccharide export with SLBB domain